MDMEGIILFCLRDGMAIVQPHAGAQPPFLARSPGKQCISIVIL